MPRLPITRPLKTDVTANDTPVIVPTMPLARSRRSSGTSSVTHVDIAMLRIWPATEPSRVRLVITQNIGLLRLSRSSAGTIRNTAVAPMNPSAMIAVASTIDGCLR